MRILAPVMQPNAATIDAWQQSRFGLCHVSAARTPHEPRTWATEDILDLEDVVYSSSKRLLAIARREFRSLTANPHTKMIEIPMGELSDGMDVPQTAILSILRLTLQAHSRDLTRRQQQAMAALEEAVQMGVTPSIHTAKKLGINRHSAYKLLRRALEMETFRQFEAYIDRENGYSDDWHPSPKQITAMMKSRPRICAHCGGKTYDGSVPLCFQCHSLLGSLREETWPQRTRAWLVPEINRIRREHRDWAVNELYLRHYGTVELDNPDVYQDAA